MKWGTSWTLGPWLYSPGIPRVPWVLLSAQVGPLTFCSFTLARWMGMLSLLSPTMLPLIWRTWAGYLRPPFFPIASGQLRGVDCKPRVSGSDTGVSTWKQACEAPSNTQVNGAKLTPLLPKQDPKHLCLLYVESVRKNKIVGNVSCYLNYLLAIFQTWNVY